MESEKNVIVTGGTSGLGMALVYKFSKKGYTVATCGRNRETLNVLKSSGIAAIECDIRIPSSVSYFFRRVRELMNTAQIVILNAGTIGPIPLKSVADTNITEIRGVMETNFFGNFRFLMESIRMMREKGLIVHITSDAASNDYPGWGAYSASKVAFDKIISISNAELSGTKIKAISIDPGDMDTPMHRLVLPDDVGLQTPDEAASRIIDQIEEMMKDD
jgi:NAD(P)-dependent dehydrogenase (short-subunit alcohol dehydrogenase family)